jgi:LPXTG-motif cell wall-anchored protein
LGKGENRRGDNVLSVSCDRYVDMKAQHPARYILKTNGDSIVKTNAFTRVTLGAAALSVCLVGFSTPAFAATVTPDSSSVVDTAVKDQGATTYSADGTFITYTAKAVDTDAFNQVYVKNVLTDETKLVSNADGGAASNGDSSSPVISADGTRLLFLSTSTDLVSQEVANENNSSNLYYVDLTSGAHTLLSVKADGTATGNVSSFALSGDGQTVVYATTTQDVVAGVTDVADTSDLFRYSFADNTTTLVTHAADNETVTSNGQKLRPVLNFDGSDLTFATEEVTNLSPVPVPAVEGPQLVEQNDGNDFNVIDLNAGTVTVDDYAYLTAGVIPAATVFSAATNARMVSAAVAAPTVAQPVVVEGGTVVPAATEPVPVEGGSSVEIVDGNATPTPQASGTPTVNGDGNANCGDFASQQEAQASMNATGNTSLNKGGDSALACDGYDYKNSAGKQASGNETLPKTGADGVYGTMGAGLSLLVLGAGTVLSRRFLTRSA